jgi:poly-gamma-glutamate system protein
MKRLYWRPRGIAPSVLVIIALISLTGLVAVEFLGSKRKQPHFREKLRAAQLAQEAMEVIKEERLRINPVIDPAIDPAQTGLIGSLMTSVTTASAPLSAKQTSANPNFAAVIVEMLRRAGAEEGDVVAIGWSGSFPALNICTYAAVRTLKLRPIIISSVAASQFGANDPKLLWIDMERILNERNVFPFRSITASIGGVEDRGVGLSEEGLQLLTTGVARNGLKLLKPKDFTDSINKRMALYEQAAGDAPIRVYINVGSGTVSVGTQLGKRAFQAGLSARKPTGARYIDSIMTRFIDEGVPVIHLVKVERMAATYRLPLQPMSLPMPGEGGVFYREEYNRWLAGGALLVIFASLYAFVRSEVGYRILQTSSPKHEDTFYEPMV